MELRHRRYFVAVAEELNFRRAAERLHLAQPSLSRQIRDLEQEVGARLFERDRRRVKLTPAGDVLLGEGRGVLAAAETALKATREAGRGRRGALRIGNIGVLTTSFLPGSMAALRERLPRVDIEIVELGLDEQVAALLAGTIEVGFQALARGTGVDPRFAARAVSACDLVVAVPARHRLAAEPAIILSALAGETLLNIEPRPGSGYDRWVSAVCEAAGGFTPKFRRPAVDNALALYGLIAAGEGLAILPEIVLRRANLGVGWVAKPLCSPRLRFEVIAVWNPGRPSVWLDHYLSLFPEDVSAADPPPPSGRPGTKSSSASPPGSPTADD